MGIRCLGASLPVPWRAGRRPPGLGDVVLAAAVLLMSCRGPGPASSASSLEPVRIAADGRHFVLDRSGTRFTPWGFNYDRDAAGRLLEDYWDLEWATVVEDFAEMKALGANVVRVHLQLAKFMRTADAGDDRESLERLAGRGDPQA